MVRVFGIRSILHSCIGEIDANCEMNTSFLARNLGGPPAPELVSIKSLHGAASNDTVLVPIARTIVPARRCWPGDWPGAPGCATRFTASSMILEIVRSERSERADYT
jgi:hypothetical protein